MRVSIMMSILLAHGLMNAMDDNKHESVPVFGTLLYQLSTQLGSATPSIIHLIGQGEGTCIKSPSPQTLHEHCAEHIENQLQSIHQSKPSILLAAAQVGGLALVLGAGAGRMLSEMCPGLEFIFPSVAAMGGALWGAAQAIQHREQIARKEGYIQGVAHTAGIHSIMQSARQRTKTAHSSTTR